ncbi:hypothetical protein BJ138DRAFT_274556 [Hygrophoropsis aurantiaca]|uniref:Uncharacterized protein n=1 Tax=Hygrophoropsis aurantiaca TaxID=72124 RepID=A0ACB8A7N8_9AGAM|nr:hypothetical protein BJ138DRAFT_274556 [Hygrophoropsis aurantiaca]
MVALKSALFVTLISVISFAAAKCVHSNSKFGLSLGIYENYHCITHNGDDPHDKVDHYNFHGAALAKGWSQDGCQCLDFRSHGVHSVQSIVLTLGHKQASMDLLYGEKCEQPYDDHDEVYKEENYINEKIKPVYNSAWVCEWGGPTNPKGPGEPSLKEVAKAAGKKGLEDVVRHIGGKIAAKLNWGALEGEGAGAVEGDTILEVGLAVAALL